MHDPEPIEMDPSSGPSAAGAAEAVTSPEVLEPGGPSDDPAHPWRARKPVIARPEGYDHGILADGRLIPSTPHEMVERVRSGGAVPMAWSPAEAYLVWPEELPFLFAEIRARVRRQATRQVLLPAGLLVLLLGLVALAQLFAWRSGREVLRAAPMWPMFAGLLGVWAAMKVVEARRAARLTPAGFRDEVEDALHEGWIGKLPAPGTRLLRYTFIGIGVLQALAGAMGHSTLMAAALVKPAVRENGELWRLLSASVLHAGLIHFFLNFTALLWLARLIEVHANRACQALSFVAGAVAGNLLSLLLVPNGVSVGASTGLMGMFGFLAVLAWRRRDRMPHGLLRGVLLNLAFIAGMGLVAAGVIDNAGHLGGLIGGLLTGFAAIPRTDAADAVGWIPGRPLNAAGWLALVTIVGTAAATGTYLFVSRW